MKKNSVFNFFQSHLIATLSMAASIIAIFTIPQTFTILDPLFLSIESENGIIKNVQVQRYIYLIIIIGSIIICSWIFSLYHEIKRINILAGRDTRKLFYDYDSYLQSVEDMIGYIYKESEIHSRIDISYKEIIHEIDRVGNTVSTQKYKIRCIDKSTHYFGISIFADDETLAIQGFKNLGLDIQYRDINSGKKVWRRTSFLPHVDATKEKKTANRYE